MDSLVPPVQTLSGEDQAKLATICGLFAGGVKHDHGGGGGKRTFREVAREEIQREPSAVDGMIAKSKVIAAFGRRKFDREEICGGDADDEEDEEEDKRPRSDKVWKKKGGFVCCRKKKP